jgi:hypothetical protein
VDECGLTQSIVDRRMFIKHGTNPGDILIVLVYVDDAWTISTSEEMRSDLDIKWKARFTLSSNCTETDGDFIGVNIRRQGDNSVELSCGRLFDDLERKLKGHPLPSGFTVDYPMSHDGLALLAAPESENNPLLDLVLQTLARSVLGTGGFIVCANRPDAFLSFSAIAQRIAHHFTSHVWRCLLRWAYYLIATRHLCLTFRFTPQPIFAAHSDSSVANLKDGSCFGGYTFGVENNTSGLVDWKCVVPRHFSDSSAAAELVMATMSTKMILGFRMLLSELKMLSPGPTALYLDANAVINGADMEKVTREMRFMAARYSMLRHVVAQGAVSLEKVDTTVNKADIFTKPLTGAAFLRARALVLGLHEPI